jgi:hypothetical protein
LAQTRDTTSGTVRAVRFAARIDPELLALILRLAKNKELSIAEINRRVGERAEVLGRHRPSYAGVRLLVGDVRMYPEDPSWAELLWNVTTRVDHPDVLIDKHVGLIATKNLPEDHGIR